MSKYERAEQKYIQMVKLIKELCIIRRGKIDHREYDLILCQFDTTIQALLLYVALLNGYLGDNEKNFITGITIYGNLMDQLNVTGQRKLFRQWQPLDWDNINETSIDQKTLIGLIKTTMTSEVSSFVTELAMIDKDISTKSYIEEISAQIPGIIKAVCLAEDDALDAEKLYEAIGKGMDFYNNTFRGFWEDMVQRR